MNREKLLEILREFVDTKRKAAIAALRNSGVPVSDDATSDEVYDTILSELENFNGYLVFHLEQSIGKDKKSGIAAGVGEAIGGVAGMFGALFGKIGAGKERRANLQMAQMQYNQSKLLARVRGQEAQAAVAISRVKAASRRKTMITVAWIGGGVLLLGGIVVAFILVKKRRLKRAA